MSENFCENLGVYRGMPVEVAIGEDDKRILGTVIDFEENEVCVGPVSGGEGFPEVEPHESVGLRGRTSDSDFFALAGVVYGGGRAFLRIGRLRIHNEAERRNAYRQNIRRDATIKFLSGANSKTTRREVDCQVMDISVGGARIRCTTDYQVDDEVQLSNFRIASDERYAFKCSIQWKKEGIIGNIYGCQFYGLTTRMEDQLQREILQAQREEIRRRRDMEE